MPAASFCVQGCRCSVSPLCALHWLLGSPAGFCLCLDLLNAGVKSAFPTARLPAGGLCLWSLGHPFMWRLDIQSELSQGLKNQEAQLEPGWSGYISQGSCAVWDVCSGQFGQGQQCYLWVFLANVLLPLFFSFRISWWCKNLYLGALL